MTYALGTATGKIELEYDGSGVKDAEKDVEGLKNKSSKAIGSIDKLGGIAGKAGLVIAGGLGAGIAAAANFEQRISAISAVSGATGKELDGLRDKALQLGKDTAFSASESAQAIEELVKAGLTTKDVLNGAADATVALAAAGEVDMPTAATIASNAMNQFGIGAKDMVGVADQIAGAANASAIDVTDLGQSLQQVGAVANLAGVSFEDTATAIALMGNAGIKGSDAGTSLKSMFQRLQPTTKAQVEEFSRLGILAFNTENAMKTLRDNGVKPAGKDFETLNTQLNELAAGLSDSKVGSAKAASAQEKLMLQTGALDNAFYDANGNLKSMGEIAGILQGSLKGMTKEQKQSTLQTIFGSDAIRAAAILSNEGAKGFDKMAKSMNKVSAADVAKTRMDNFKGSLEQMKGSLETAGIALGTILLPALRSLVDFLTKGLNWFLNLSDGTQKFIVVALAAVGSLLLIVAGIAKLVVFINTVRTALIALRGTMIATWAATLGPILLVIAAVAAVIAIIVLLWKKNETFRKIVLAVWDAIKSGVSAVIDWFKGLPDFFSGLWNDIKSAFSAGVDAVVGFIKDNWRIIISILLGPLGIAIALITKYWDQIKAVFNAAVAIITSVMKAAWSFFGPLVKAMWGLVVAIVRLGWTIIKGLFILYIRFLKKVFGAVWDFLVKVVKKGWSLIVKVVKFYINTVKKIISAVWNTIKDITSAVWNGIKAVIQKVWDIIGPFIMKRVENIKNNISRVWNAIKTATSAVWNKLKEIVGNAVDGIVDIAGNIKDRVLGFFSDAGTWLYDAGKKIITGLMDGITAMIGKLTDKIGDVTGAIGKFLPGSPVQEGPLKVLNRGYAGGQIMKMLMDGIAGQQWALQRQVGDVAGLMVNTGLTPVAYATGGSGRGSSGNGSQAGSRSLSVQVVNPTPERASQSVSKVLRDKVTEEGWLR